MSKSFLLALLTTMTLSVSAQQTVQIRVNQVGYYPDQEKTAVVEGINQNTKIVFKNEKGKSVLKTKPVRMAKSPWGDKERYIVDFSSLKKPGNYRMEVNGQSQAFTVRNGALNDLSRAALKLFYLIRSGVPIEKEFAGEYARPAGHLDTHVLVHPSAATEQRPEGFVISSPYGWYDAGDYNKYIVNSAYTVAVMLLSYAENEAYYKGLDTHIPESGNGTADLLDEVMFNLKWMLTMQDPNDGGVYHKLTTPNFEGFIMPKDCQQQRYVVAKSVTATYDFAAVMAQAARIFRGNPDYAGFAAQAEQQAVKAYQWAQANPKAFYNQMALSREFKPAVNTGTYGDFNAQDEQFWAATELYLLTRDGSYLADARNSMPKAFTTPTWGLVASLGALEWVKSANEPLTQEMRNQLKEYADKRIEKVGESSFQAPFGDSKGDFGWGCLAEQCCMPAIALLYADKYLDKGKYMVHAMQNVDYMLGRNALGYCYVTGFGQKSPMHPHHRISEADGIEAPFPGMLVGGPNAGQQDKGAGITYLSNLPDESYLDVMDSYASNEIAINWNGALVALLGWLDAIY